MANYGYHLDAGRFAELLQRHCTSQLGVRHVLDHVTAVNGRPDGDVVSLSTAGSGDLEGDLFIDCTGLAALLIGKHYGVPFADKGHILFNDSALALQVPYADEDSPIASQTVSTAQAAGWIWDIGLTSRRGIGYTFSSQHTTDAEAEVVLRDYVGRTSGAAASALEPRKISFRPGHRERFWHRNCVAVGMSAGFKLQLSLKEKGLSQNTVKSCLQVLMSLMQRYHIRKQILDRVPPFPEKWSATPQQDRWVVDEATQRQMWERMPVGTHLLMEVLCSLGCRPSGACALKKRDLLPDGKIVIQRAVNVYGEIKDTKTGKSRAHILLPYFTLDCRRCHYYLTDIYSSDKMDARTIQIVCPVCSERQTLTAQSRCTPSPATPSPPASPAKRGRKASGKRQGQ